jgi:hypothetical protein
VLRASVSVSTNTARATFANNAHDCASMRADDDVDVVGTYRALEERCARDVTRGGYPCELLDLRVTSCVDEDADDDGRGGLGLPENVARMERDWKSEFRMLARGGRVHGRRRGGPRRRPWAAAAAAEGGGVMFRGGR